MLRPGLAREHLPAPLVDQLAERQERDLGQGALHLRVDQRLLVVLHLLDQADLLQVLRRDRQGDGVADRLVEAIMRAALVQLRLLVVVQEIIDVAHLVVDRLQAFLVRADAHLHAHIAVLVEVPGAGVADHVAVAWPGQLRLVPEAAGQGGEADRGVEVLGDLRRVLRELRIHLLLHRGLLLGRRLLSWMLLGELRLVLGQLLLLQRIVALAQRAVDVEAAGVLVRLGQVVNVAPVLRPHIAEQVGRDQAVLRHQVAVLLVQARTHEAVQLFVQRLHLRPQAFGLAGELLRRHVVAGAPQLAGVPVAQLHRALIHQLRQPGVILLHRLAHAVPAGPGLGQGPGVARVVDDLLQLIEIEAVVAALARRAPLAGAVLAVEPGRQARQFAALVGIARRRHRVGNLQQLDRAPSPAAGPGR